METNEKSKALVIHSGGQDSTTCLAWALENFDEVETVTFDYGQRHKVELECAKKIAEELGIRHKLIHIDTFQELGENSLTHNLEIDASKPGLPNTFVPGRNLIFITYAAAYAYNKKIPNLITGVCQTDYSGYPDCREETIKALEKSISLGMEFQFKIHTPLMHLTKAETIKIMQELGNLELLAKSHTCYEGQRPACGKCPSCILRFKGFKEAGIKDPLEYNL